MYDLNKEIFTRKGAEKKNAIINAATEDDLMRVSKDTIIRIIKEVGKKVYIGNGKYSSRDKTLRIPHENGGGNHWNSRVESVNFRKGKLFVNPYVQYSNTDTTDCEYYEIFFRSGDYVGHIQYGDCYGSTQTAHYRYDRSDKAGVIKAILLTYVQRKEAIKNAKKEAA